MEKIAGLRPPKCPKGVIVTGQLDNFCKLQKHHDWSALFEYSKIKSFIPDALQNI